MIDDTQFYLIVLCQIDQAACYPFGAAIDCKPLDLIAELRIVFRQQFKDQSVQFAVAADMRIPRLNRAGDERCVRYC